MDKTILEQVTDTFRDLDIDSIDSVEIIMSMEERFTIEIPDIDAEKLDTVEQCANYIEKRLKEDK